MSKRSIRILLDQNIPYALTIWLHTQRPDWNFTHINDHQMQGQPDEAIYLWAQANHAIIVTFDEDFADSRFYPLGTHCGVIRLRVWPTTIEQIKGALLRLFDAVSENELVGSLIIVHNDKIRIRRLPQGKAQS